MVINAGTPLLFMGEVVGTFTGETKPCRCGGLAHGCETVDTGYGVICEGMLEQDIIGVNVNDRSLDGFAMWMIERLLSMEYVRGGEKFTKEDHEKAQRVLNAPKN